MTFKWLLPTALLSVASLVGCTGEGNTQALEEAVTAGSLDAQSLSIAPTFNTEIIGVGETLAYQATAANAAGVSTTVTDRVRWSVSNVTAATINDAGVVTGSNITGQVQVTVTAQLANLSATDTLTVSSASLQSIALSGAASVDECRAETYAATGTFDDGSQRSLQASTLNWASSSASVARFEAVNNSRLLTFGTGTLNITATSGSIVSTPLAITVNDVNPTLAFVGANPMVIGQGSSTQLMVNGTFASGTENVTDRMMGWTSSAANIATVSATGVVQGLATGDANISASCGGQTAMTTVTVQGITQIQLRDPGNDDTPDNAIQPTDGTIQLRLFTSFDNGASFPNEVTDIDVLREATWTVVTDNTQFAINNTGLVTVPTTLPSGSITFRAQFRGQTDDISFNLP